MELTLLRISGDTDSPHLGVIVHNNVPRWTTLELPWRQNLRNISCIPPGRHRCKRVISLKAGLTWEIEVSGRDGILFHVANTQDDLRGCIGVGFRFKLFEGLPGIGESKDGFEDFRQTLKDYTEFCLNVRGIHETIIHDYADGSHSLLDEGSVDVHINRS